MAQDRLAADTQPALGLEPELERPAQLLPQREPGLPQEPELEKRRERWEEIL